MALPPFIIKILLIADLKGVKILMYGVVLWSNHNERKAVIWCEDHGDLAYYGGSASSVFDGYSLDAGDLVQFQLQEGAPMRLARNPELVSEQYAPALAERLKAAIVPGAGEAKQPISSNKNSSNILVFPSLRSA
ncbi:hypothetical protein [Lentibacter sp. XHP0401]|uniref:hypothetical protein n=1 Tax=Lentibacter sp. XHP0401 TaxID=2984334 RepID=UPI0021E955DD|nr:hypothetical protein [Lentibacter sp. XHP0401]MCV2891780.1 hypothetical protein [Lentibacter sp. XHP0401]